MKGSEECNEWCVACRLAWRDDGRRAMRRADCDPAGSEDCHDYVQVRCLMDDHRYCDCDEHEWLVERAVPVGVEAATRTRPFTVVTYDHESQSVEARTTHASLRAAKPARTSEGRRVLGLSSTDDFTERMWGPKTVAVIVCLWGHLH